MELRFGLPLRHNKLGTLAELRRTGTVAEYQGRFMNLLSRAGELTEEQKIELFTMELQGKLLIDVELEAPASQDTAMSFFIFFYFFILEKGIFLPGLYIQPDICSHFKLET